MGDSVPKMKEVEQKEKVLLYSSYFEVEKTFPHRLGVTDVELEVDLILARASMFTAPDDISRITICPPHRSFLGNRWKRGSHRCRVPELLLSHAHGKSLKANREIKDHS